MGSFEGQISEDVAFVDGAKESIKRYLQPPGLGEAIVS